MNFFSKVVFILDLGKIEVFEKFPLLFYVLVFQNRPWWAHGAKFVLGGIILDAAHNGGNHFRRIRIYRLLGAIPVFRPV